MSDTRTDHIASVLEGFEIVSHSLRGQTVSDWVELDLTMAQLKTLFTLEYAGPATIGQTAERLGISLPTASHLIDRLVNGGFADRTEDPADRRRTVAAVTAKGTALTRRLRQGSRDSLLNWLSELDDQALAALAKGIASLAHVAVSSAECVTESTTAGSTN